MGGVKLKTNLSPFDFLNSINTNKVILAVIIVILLFWFFLGHRILRCFLGFYHDRDFQQFGGVPEH